MEENRPLYSGDADKEPAGETPDTGKPPAPDTEKPSQEPEPTTPPITGQEPGTETAEEKTAKAFKTWEEAEKSYAELRKEYSRSQNEKAEMERKLRQWEEAQKAEKQWQDTSAKLREIAAAEYEKAVQAANALDPDDETYAKKYAAIQAERDIAIRSAERSLSFRQEPEREPVQTPEAEVSAIRNELQTMLKEAELEHDDPIVQGYLHTQSATDSKGRPLTPQQQMSEVIRKTREYQTSLAKRTRQAVSNPLPRSGPGKPEPEKPGPEPNQPLGSYWKH